MGCSLQGRKEQTHFKVKSLCCAVLELVHYSNQTLKSPTQLLLPDQGSPGSWILKEDLRVNLFRLPFCNCSVQCVWMLVHCNADVHKCKHNLRGIYCINFPLQWPDNRRLCYRDYVIISRCWICHSTVTLQLIQIKKDIFSRHKKLYIFNFQKYQISKANRK